MTGTPWAGPARRATPVVPRDAGARQAPQTELAGPRATAARCVCGAHPLPRGGGSGRAGVACQELPRLERPAPASDAQLGVGGRRGRGAGVASSSFIGAARPRSDDKARAARPERGRAAPRP